MGTAGLLGGEQVEAPALDLVADEAWHPYVVLRVTGEVDLCTAPRLGEALASLVRKGKRNVVVDLEGVEFLDSTGLRVLMESWRKLHALGGALRVVCTHGIITRAFKMTGLDRTLPLHTSVEEAVGAQPSDTASTVQ